jgi:hypothetical protein
VGALHRPSDLEQECNHNRPPSAKRRSRRGRRIPGARPVPCAPCLDHLSDARPTMTANSRGGCPTRQPSTRPSAPRRTRTLSQAPDPPPDSAAREVAARVVGFNTPAEGPAHVDSPALSPWLSLSETRDCPAPGGQHCSNTLPDETRDLLDPIKQCGTRTQCQSIRSHLD